MPFNRNPFKDEPTPLNVPASTDNLEGQNKHLYEHLASGNTINFLQARDMDIDFLETRVADLRKHQIQVYSRIIRISGIKCEEYSMQPFTDQ